MSWIKLWCCLSDLMQQRLNVKNNIILQTIANIFFIKGTLLYVGFIGI